MIYAVITLSIAFIAIVAAMARQECTHRRERWHDKCLIAEARDALIEVTPVWRSCADDVPSTDRNVIVDEFELLMMRWDAGKWRPLDASLEEGYNAGLFLGAMWCELPEREAAQ